MGATRVPGIVLGIVLSTLLIACSTPAPVVRYDFGVPPVVNTPPLAPVPGDYAAAEVEVLAPAWLDTPAMLYRLAYADESQVHAYAQSQWVAPPARLVEQAMRRVGTVHGELSCGGSTTREAAPAAAATRVAVDLEEFSQVFDAPQASRVVLRARARLLAARTHAVLAQRDFDLRSAAPSADAPGAVHGLQDLTNLFAASVTTWAAAQALPPCESAAVAPAGGR
jgi:cholesterol transport system auxiliary component